MERAIPSVHRLTSALEFNQHAIALRANGRSDEAVAVLRFAVQAFPNEDSLHTNLAFLLNETGDAAGALAAYDRAVACNPSSLEPYVAKAFLLFRCARNEEAQAAFLQALSIDACDVRANFGMYDLLHVKGEPERAIAFQKRALERQQLFSTIAFEEQRSVLVLCTPGDFQANIPLDFVFDSRTTTVHKLYLLDAAQLEKIALPRYDVVFNAIGESSDAAAALSLADAFIHAQRRPFINRPDRVLRTNRVRLIETLRDVDCRLADIVTLERGSIHDAALPFAYPLIIRPVGSHAGHGLEKIDDSAGLTEYVARTDAPEFFLSPFIDYRNADGLYRKYRIFCVDGEPYPCHLAISPNWMIHYYNAPMREHRWMRDEEAHFLGEFDRVFGPELQGALRSVAGALGLEYFGIDCTVDADGRLLIFEADPAMVVHTSDPVEIYPYKHEYVPRIFRAVERMLDRRARAN
ncbi:MAG: tetratricopeptide repeat protein [Vulcanimicrobiaceae bacterium]